MPRNFDTILAEITAKSDPQRKIVLDQVAALPTQQAADEAGLEAKKTQAFDEILGGARQRGLGFSGIPLGEQAKYAATDYAPALANVKAGYGQRKGTLESALADIGRSDYTTAYDIFNQDRNFAEQQRQFNLQERRAGAAQPNPFAGLFDQNKEKPADPVKVKAQNDVANLLTKDKTRIQRELNSIAASAAYGNTYDKLKLQLLQAYGYKPSQQATPGSTTPSKSLPRLGIPSPSLGGNTGINASNNLLRSIGL